MQDVFVGFVIAGLFVFLFTVISHARPDDRLLCWVSGWISILCYFVVRLWAPLTPHGQMVQLWLRSCLLFLGGEFFVVSTIAIARGRRDALRLGVATASSAFFLIALATLSPSPSLTGLLVVALLLRQSGAVVLALRDRRLQFSPMVVAIAVAIAVSSLFGISAGHPHWVVVCLWSEAFLTAALGFGYSDAVSSLAVRTIVINLIAWAAIFPISYMLYLVLPRVAVNEGIWNLPGLCTGVGMVLLLVEEQLGQARTMGQEYRLLFDNNPHPMWVLDLETERFLDVNRVAAELHGYTREEFLQLTLPEILAPECVAQAPFDVKQDTPTYTRASLHRRKDGTLLPLDITPYGIDFRGRRSRFILALDVSEREELERQLQDHGQHDPLTGLATRMLFQEHLAAAVCDARQSCEEIAILCLDICRFKRINDVYGPRVGDECIRHVAGILNARIRPGDFAARIAGDEFAVVLTGIRNAATVEQRTSELRAVLEQPVVVHGYPVQLAFSFGLAISSDDGDDPLELWSGAEGALRRSQKSGGGQTTWLSHESQDDAKEQNAIEACLRMGMTEAGFHLVYQPVYDFTGRVRGLEALLRLNHPIYGAVSPVKVISIAEDNGLIVPLGMWVIEEVCRQIRAWIDEDNMCVIPVAINVSALQLMHVDFADRFMELVRRYSINPQWIHLELTETAAMRNLKEVSGQMMRLAGLGISFFIDDFGTGHSSLGRLHQLPLSVLKIDRSFIEQICAPSGMPTTLTIVQAIVSMAHALHQKVVAEGVETAAQLACLCEIDCDLVQGFHLSRPIAPELVPRIANRRHPAFSGLTSAHCAPQILEVVSAPHCGD